MDTTSKSPGFKVFAFAWAMAGLLHQLSFPDWRWHDPKGVILSLLVLFVLQKPSAWQRFLLFVAFDWISVGIEFPEHPNHIVFSWLLNGCILTSFALVAYRNKGVSGYNLGSAWFEAFAPWARVMLCILYWFTFFHKLNYSYLDLDWSCGARLHLEINERIPVLPTAPWAQYVAAYGTLIIELILPFLLIINRTRAVAIIFGMLFHGLLALHPHVGLFSFSATMIALYTTLLPAAVAEDLKPMTWLPRIWNLALGGLLIGVVIWALRGWLPVRLNLDEKVAHLWKLGMLTYYSYLGFCLLLIGKTTLKYWKTIQLPQGTLATYPVLGVFSVILFINGIGPYFGLRTQSSFSMFSNLHTENGVSNHVIMPSGIQFTNWQSDLVEIIDTNDDELLFARDRNLLVVFLELRRVRSGNRPDFWVRFVHNGKEETFDKTKPDTYACLPPLNFLGKRYFFFRPVDKDPFKVGCKH
ncbi:MAG: HTTM domain-containing protein [Chryseolinea sp.]